MNGQKQFDYAAQTIVDQTGLNVSAACLTDMAAGLIAAAYQLNMLVAGRPECDEFRHILKERMYTSCDRDYLDAGYDIGEIMRTRTKTGQLKAGKRDRHEKAIVRKAEEFLDALKRYFDC